MSAVPTPAAGRAPARAPRVPPVAYVVGAAGSIQFGAALAATLFDDLGPGGTVFLRLLFAAVILGVAWRPRVRRRTPAEWRLAVAFGLALAGMNALFYLALDRIPLGVAVTIEFVGPLGVAVAGSRRALDGLWVLLAALGILLLGDPFSSGGGIDPLGAGLALAAGGLWALYIVLNGRAGRAFAGGTGLALAMGVGALALLPLGVLDGGRELLRPHLLLLGAGVALLSSAIPYSLELEALRRLPSHVFGVLMSLEPGVAALAGWLVLGQALGARELVAVALVVVASAGAARGARGVGEP